MELFTILLFFILIIAILILVRTYQENKDVCKNDNDIKLKLLNQNTTIIFLLFILIVSLWLKIN